MVRDIKISTQAEDENAIYHMVECNCDGCDGNGSQNTSPRTSWHGLIFAGFVLTIRSQKGAVKLVSRYWRDKRISREMQINNTGGETMRGLLGWIMKLATQTHTRKRSRWQVTVGYA